MSKIKIKAKSKSASTGKKPVKTTKKTSAAPKSNDKLARYFKEVKAEWVSFGKKLDEMGKHFADIGHKFQDSLKQSKKEVKKATKKAPAKKAKK